MDFLAFFDGLFASASAARSGAEVSEQTNASQANKVDTHVENTKATAPQHRIVLTHYKRPRMKLNRNRLQRSWLNAETPVPVKMNFGTAVLFALSVFL